MLLELTSIVGAQEKAVRVPGVVVVMRVYRFQADAEKAEPFLETLLPTPVDGANASGRFGVLKEKGLERLREDLEQQGSVEALAYPVLASVSGRPATIQSRKIAPRDHGRVGRIDVVPIVLGNGNWRLEMRSEINDAGHLQTVKDADGVNPAARKRWIDVAAELKLGQTMVSAMLDPKTKDSDSSDKKLTCTLFVATLMNPAPVR